jgi:hypothetical protein
MNKWIRSSLLATNRRLDEVYSGVDFAPVAVQEPDATYERPTSGESHLQDAT